MWTVKLMNGNVIVLPQVKFDDVIGYIYEDGMNGPHWTITQYWPVCMKFTFGNQYNWQFILNRIVLSNNNIVAQLRS